MALGSYYDEFQDTELSDLSSWPYWLKVVVSILLGIVILGGGYKLFYLPKQERLYAAENKEIVLKAEFKKKQELAANLPAYEEQMIEIQSRFRVLLKQLPNQTEIPALLTDISQVGKERGLEFRYFKPSEAKLKDFYVEMPIQIEASGTYHQLANFISDIVNFERVVTVGDINMQRTQLKQDTLTPVEDIPLTFAATLYTYHYNELEKREDLEEVSSK